MLLGDLIARLDDEAVAAEALIGLADLSLVARVEAAAEASGLTPGAVAARAVAAFADGASEDDWLSLVGSLSRSDEPGRECLRRMLEASLPAA